MCFLRNVNGLWNYLAIGCSRDEVSNCQQGYDVKEVARTEKKAQVKFKKRGK